MATATEPASVSWDDLAEPIEMPNGAAVDKRRADVIRDTPEKIRMWAEKSLTKTVALFAAKADSNAARVRIDPYWSVQAVPSEDSGAEFKRLITRYCKYRPSNGPIPYADAASPLGQVTVRCGDPARYITTATGPQVTSDPKAKDAFWGVRFSVRPFEARKDTTRSTETP